MIEHTPIDHTPFDVEFCGDPSDNAEFKRLLERLDAHLARHLCQSLRLQVPSGAPRKLVSFTVDHFVLDQSPAFTSVQFESALAQLSNRDGCDHD